MASRPLDRPAGHEPVVLTIRPRRVSATLGLIAAALVVLSVAGQVLRHVTGHDWALGFVPLFHLAQENNISTFFASLLLLTAAGLVALVWWRERSLGIRDARYWLGLCGIFLYMTLDEAVMIHERTIEPLRETFGATGLLYFTWVVPAAVLVVLVVAVLLPFLFRLPRSTLRLLVLSGILFVGGAIGMELLGGWYVEANGFGTPIWNLLTTVEESMEMAGVIVFIHAVLLYLTGPAEELRLEVPV